MTDLYFAQVREDSMVERALQTERASRRIVCIGSGGCTALSLLRDEVERVYAVDSNPAQCALLELKKAAVGLLDRDAYLAFVGESHAGDRLETYARLAVRLPAYAREYWDKHPADLLLGINQCGATERFYRFVGANLRNSVCADAVWRELFDCASVEEQRVLYARHFTAESWRTAIRVLLSRTTHLQFFPSFMFAQATEHDLGRFFAGQFERELLGKSVANNYFLSQFVFSSYLADRPQGTPHYLSEQGWTAARGNLEKLIVVHETLQEILPRLSGVQAFFLSNVFDWAGAEDRRRICQGILRAADRDSLVLYRNMLSAHPLPEFFRERLVVDKARCARLHGMERSMMYQQVVAGEIA
ncbi:MAG: DUF3419 family protein [Pseudomonadota bacterium]